MSNGRVGELLQIRDAFPDSVVLRIGIPIDDDRDDALRLLCERGAARLSRLSYRALRAAARLPSMQARITEVRRVALPPDVDMTIPIDCRGSRASRG
jgi:hypothetical protein